MSWKSNIEMLEQRMWRVISTLETLERDYNQRNEWKIDKALTNFIYGDVDDYTKKVMYDNDRLRNNISKKHDELINNNDNTIKNIMQKLEYLSEKVEMNTNLLTKQTGKKYTRLSKKDMLYISAEKYSIILSNILSQIKEINKIEINLMEKE